MDKLFLDKDSEVEEVEGSVDNKRRVRFPVCLKVSSDGTAEECADFILNLGKGGVFVVTDTPARKGSSVRLRFYIPPDEKVLSELEGLVVGVSAEDPMYPKGMHVRFVNCSKEDLKKLEELLEGKRHLVDREA